MPVRTSQLIDVPANLVAEVVESYYRDGAVMVVPKPMQDGTWVVTAQFHQEEVRRPPAASASSPA